MAREPVQEVVDGARRVDAEREAGLVARDPAEVARPGGLPRPAVGLGEALHETDHHVPVRRVGGVSDREAVVDRLGRRLLEEGVGAGLEAVAGDRRLKPRVHRDDDSVGTLALQKRAVIGVVAADPEVPGGAARTSVVEVAARDELADLAAFRQLADRGSRLRRVQDREAEAGIEVLNRMAAAADHRDPGEPCHRAILSGSCQPGHDRAQSGIELR